MVKLLCDCLNICVDVVGSNLREADGNLFVSDGSSDTFFREKLYEVHLAVGGIQKELEILIRQRRVEDWIVFKCLGCNSEVFALHSVKGNERVLVNQRIQSDPKKIADLVESKNRSPAFKVILNPLIEEDSNKIGNGFSNDSISCAGARVQEHTKRYLKSEEEAMEERINCYAAVQRKQFAKVQSRAYNDKKVMLSILRKAAESKVEECLSDAMIDVVDGGDLERISEERPLHLPVGYLEDVTNIEIFQPSNCEKSPNKKNNELEGDHFGPIFMADEECEPFDEETDDDEECSDNSLNQREEVEKTRFSNKTKYSSSVPVNVPFLHHTSCRKHERIMGKDNVHFEAPSPEKMAESIKALARSVHDSRDIFGELPRPRVNTLTLPLT